MYKVYVSKKKKVEIKKILPLIIPKIAVTFLLIIKECTLHQEETWLPR